MSEETVRVIVRCRPLNRREKDLKCKVVVDVFNDFGQVALAKPGSNDPPKKFTFDGAYGVDSNSKMIYEDMGFPLIEAVLEGYNGTVFAYGQTGCGKSFTMEGIPNPPEHRGITPRSFEHIFQEVAVRENTKFLVRASYLEIYNESVRDLLGTNHEEKLELKEHPERGVYVKGLTEHIVHDADEVLKIMALGSKNRSVGATLMNADSSRSHSIFTVLIEACETAEGDEKIRASKLNLVDLAGSERQGKTGATGTRLKEATKINLSLSALGNVISALVDGKAKHIPYRDSKLTRLLQDSLGGNTKTLMVAALSPADNNYDETLSTLRYANRAKNIKNKAIINEDPKDALLRQYQEEILKLKELLMTQGSIDPSLLANLGANNTGPASPKGVKPSPSQPPAQTEVKLTDEQIKEIEDRVRQEKELELREVEDKLKVDYDKKLEDLQTAVEEQRMTNEKLEQEFERLTNEYTSNKESARAKAKTEIEEQVANAVEEEEGVMRGVDGTEPAFGGSLLLEDVTDSSDTHVPPPASTVVTFEEETAKLDSMMSSEKREVEVIPYCYVVVDGKTDEVHFCVRQAGSRAFYKSAEGFDGCLHPVVADGADDSLKPIRVKYGKAGMYAMIKKVFQYPVSAVAAVLADGSVQAALLGTNHTPVTVRCGYLGELEVALNISDEEEDILNAEGLPVVHLPLDKNTIVVCDREGNPTVAYVTQDGLPVECVAIDGVLQPKPNPQIASSPASSPSPTNQEDGKDGEEGGLKKDNSISPSKYIPIIGSDGLPAVPVVCNHSCTKLPMRALLVRKDSILTPCIVSADGIPIRAKFDPASGLFVPCLRDEKDSSSYDVMCTKEDTKSCIKLVYADATVIVESVARKLDAMNAAKEQAGDELGRRVSLINVVDDVSMEGKPQQPGTNAPSNNTISQPSLDEIAALQAKVQALESQMVSGGKTKSEDKTALKEKLSKRRKLAKDKRKKVLEKIRDADDNGILENLYDDMQDQLKGKNRNLEKAKEIIRSQKHEIQDLQEEFEREREALLAEIRHSEQEKKFYMQYVEKVLPVVRADCNYNNLTKIRNASVWDAERLRWMMPSLTRETFRLPSGRERPSRQGSALSIASDEEGPDRQRRNGKPSHSTSQSSDFLSSSQKEAVLSRMQTRGFEIEKQQELRAQVFQHNPMSSSRAQQLLNRDRSPLTTRKHRRAEPGAVSIADMSRNLKPNAATATLSTLRRPRKIREKRDDDW
eukprot:m.26433 g.26433  ORF g.26433 m.26433 type:complete len:1233 (+) comp5858_c0_seq1:355-4053(+)